MNTIQKATIGNKELRIMQEENPISPREWSNLGTMVCWHREYDLGDKHEFDTPNEFSEWLKENKAIVLPIYMYDHSGIGISTHNTEYPFNCPWDSGQLGYIYVTHDKIKEEFSTKRITQELIEKAKQQLLGEIETYNQYLQNDIYGFAIIEKSTCKECGTEKETVLDSVGGFYGHNFKENGLLDNAGSEWKDAVLEDVQQ
jgi:hypothetical protein